MTKKELIESIKDFPDSAIIYVYADHGQEAEQANFINTTSDEELEYYGNDHFDDEDIEPNVVTAIEIS